MYYILLQLTAIQAVVSGQEGDKGIIQGTVTDVHSKEPLIGVNVVVVGSSLGASTDISGNFVIEEIPVGKYSLEISYIGYTTFFKTDISVKRGKPAVVNTELHDAAIEGEEVIVTAGYFIEETMTQPSTIGLSREEIRRFPGGFEDVVRTVITLPGVAINTSGGRNDLLVRGGGPSENLYIIENIEVPNINHFGTQGNSSGSLSFINLDFVDNVSFSTGGFKSRYGDKMSSVLELTLADGRTDRLGGKVLVSATQFGFNMEGPVSSAGNFIFSARKSYLDLIFKAAGLPFVPVYTDYNFSFKYNLTPRDKLYVLGLAAIDRVDREQSSEENRVTNAGLLNNTQNQYIGGLNYRRIMNKGYLDITLGTNLFKYRFSQIDEKQQEYFNSQADEREINLKINNYKSLSGKIGLFSGISLKSVRNNNTTIFADTIYDRSGNRVPPSSIGVPVYTSVNASAYKLAGFLEIDWTFSTRLSFNGGLRLDNYPFIDQSLYISPRLSLKYKAGERNNIRISGGIYYQSPSYVWVVNPFNKQLRAPKNQMIIAGWDYLIRNDFRLAVEGYYKRYSNLPTGTIPGITDYIILTNTGTGFGGREDDFQSFGYFDLVPEAKGIVYGLDILLQKNFQKFPAMDRLVLHLERAILRRVTDGIIPASMTRDLSSTFQVAIFSTRTGNSVPNSDSLPEYLIPRYIVHRIIPQALEIFKISRRNIFLPV